MSESAPTIDSDVVEAFQRNGAVCVRGLISPEQVADLTDGIEENLRDPSALALVASEPDDPGWFFEDFRNWQRIAAYQRIIFDATVSATAAALMKSSTVRLYHDHLLIKEPGTRQPTPWHQDQPYYNIDGTQTVSMWLPVDPVSRDSTLEFVAGSHLGPWLMPRTFLDGEAKWFPEGTLAELPDIDADRPRFEILGWALQPGDAVFFSMLTLHTASGVGGTERRRAFSVRFLGDDVTHAPRPWKTSPPFPGLDTELPAGSPMDHPLFPVLYRDGEPGTHLAPGPRAPDAEHSD